MSPDTYTEVTSQSWLSRIGGAFVGVLIGLLMVVIAVVLLFRNEGMAVDRYKALKESAGVLVSTSSEAVDSDLEGHLVHLSALADTEQELSDPVFGVSAKALKLKRRVEMFQWKENVSSTTKKKTGGSTETTKTYSYDEAWSESLISSSSFERPEGHTNPSSMPFSSELFTADPVVFGTFELSPALIAKIGGFEPLAVDDVVPMPDQVSTNVTVHQGGVYLGADPSQPQVGDLRVRFSTVPSQEVSVIAQQAGNSFVPYEAKSGSKVLLLEPGVQSAEAMIEQARRGTKIRTWLLRLAGFVLMLIGLNLVFRPLGVLADVLPILGRIVRAGTGLIALLISLGVSLAVISMAWLFHRPQLSVPLLVLVIGAVFLLVKKLQAEKSS